MFHRLLYSSQGGRSDIIIYGSCNCPLVYLNFELSSGRYSTLYCLDPKLYNVLGPPLVTAMINGKTTTTTIMTTY